MRPGGHLATGIALSGAAYLGTGSAELAAGCLAGAFLIDVDHYVDYLTVERQWRRPGPGAFLRYYFALRCRRLVLPLHSIELTIALAAVALLWPHPVPLGYLAGSTLHLVLDILVNGEQLRCHPVLFYSFVYRVRAGFSGDRLLARLVVPPDAAGPLRQFFTWRPEVQRLDTHPPRLLPELDQVGIPPLLTREPCAPALAVRHRREVEDRTSRRDRHPGPVNHRERTVSRRLPGRSGGK